MSDKDISAEDVFVQKKHFQDKTAKTPEIIQQKLLDTKICPENLVSEVYNDTSVRNCQSMSKYRTFHQMKKLTKLFTALKMFEITWMKLRTLKKI